MDIEMQIKMWRAFRVSFGTYLYELKKATKLIIQVT